MACWLTAGMRSELASCARFSAIPSAREGREAEEDSSRLRRAACAVPRAEARTDRRTGRQTDRREQPPPLLTSAKKAVVVILWLSNTLLSVGTRFLTIRGSLGPAWRAMALRAEGAASPTPGRAQPTQTGQNSAVRGREPSTGNKPAPRSTALGSLVARNRGTPVPTAPGTHEQSAVRSWHRAPHHGGVSGWVPTVCLCQQLLWGQQDGQTKHRQLRALWAAPLAPAVPYRHLGGLAAPTLCLYPHALQQPQPAQTPNSSTSSQHTSILVSLPRGCWQGDPRCPD